jgi:hypothetical protein
MKLQSFNPTGELEIAASAESSEKDFDFLVGRWKIHNRKLKKRLAGCDEWTKFEAFAECRKILNGFGNIDSFRADSEGIPEGMALRLFNPKTKLWSIYWANSETVTLDVPQIGSFDQTVGRFYARDAFEGKEIIIVYKWDKTDALVPAWSQAFSTDNGETWEWNWYMTFYRQD